MSSYGEQLDAGRQAHLVTNALESESRRKVANAFTAWLAGDLSDHSIRYQLEDIVRSAYRSSAIVARTHVGQASEIPDWLPPKMAESTEYLKALIQDVRRNLRTYKASERTDKDLRRAMFRIGLSASVAAQRGYTDSLIHSYDYLQKQGYELTKVWMTNTLNNVPCSECRRLHGTTVGLHENFPVPTKTLNIYKDLQGPPRHPNCRCYLVILISSLENEKERLNVDNPTPPPTTMTTADVKRIPESKFKAILFTLRAIWRKVFRKFK